VSIIMSLALMPPLPQVWRPTSIPSPTRKLTNPQPRSSKESIGMMLLKHPLVPELTQLSCYNAFSRLDMRVHVTIPGTVDSYCIDERGDKRVASDELWLETYLCSVLRAYSYADDGSGDTIRKIMGVRRFNPVTNTETEHRFLQAAEQLFFRGRLI
jgi:ChAPs (Chs5p-Arf1p-binding proteins)